MSCVIRQFSFLWTLFISLIGLGAQLKWTGDSIISKQVWPPTRLQQFFIYWKHHFLSFRQTWTTCCACAAQIDLMIPVISALESLIIGDQVSIRYGHIRTTILLSDFYWNIIQTTRHMVHSQIVGHYLTHDSESLMNQLVCCHDMPQQMSHLLYILGYRLNVS